MSYYMIVTLGQGFLYLLSIASSTSTRSEDKVKFLTVPPLYANTCCKPMQGMVHRRQPADRGILQAMFTNKSDENPKILTDVIVRNSGVCGKIFPAPYGKRGMEIYRERGAFQISFPVCQNGMLWFFIFEFHDRTFPENKFLFRNV